MARNFQHAVEILRWMVHEPEADQHMRRAVVRALRHFRPRRFTFSQRSGELLLQPGIFRYGPDQGLPGDILAIHQVTLERQTQQLTLGNPVSIQEMRRLHDYARSTGWPDQWTWYGEQWWCHPIPSLADTVHFDYRADISRDERSGAVISEDSGQETNRMIEDGEGPLLAYAAYWYCMTIQRDAQRGQMFAQVLRSELEPFVLEADLREVSGGQAEVYF